MPLVDSITGNLATFRVLGPGAVMVCWGIEGGRELRLYANLSEKENNFPPTEGRILWHEGPEPEGNTYHPWVVRWALKDSKEA